jgi:hypothetical protein
MNFNPNDSVQRYLKATGFLSSSVPTVRICGGNARGPCTAEPLTADPPLSLPTAIVFACCFLGFCTEERRPPNRNPGPRSSNITEGLVYFWNLSYLVLHCAVNSQDSGACQMKPTFLFNFLSDRDAYLIRGQLQRSRI